MTTTAVSQHQTKWWSGGKSPFNVEYGKLMMWYFLMSDSFTFGAFLISYGTIRFSQNYWPSPSVVFNAFPGAGHANLPLAFVSLMTFILIMSKWLMFMLDSAKWNGKRFLKPETFAELMKPQSIVPANEFYPTMQVTKPHWTTYGLGWFQQDYRGKMIEFHTGSLDGAVAIIGLVPDQHFGIYIFENLDHAELRHG